MLGNWFKTSLLMLTVVALFGVVGGIAGLFSTQPATSERVARLLVLAR